jgi:hypothetical protein
MHSGRQRQFDQTFESERNRNMRQLLTLLAIATGCVGLASAESFNGTLIDASCYAQQAQQASPQTCAPTSSTTSFALQVSGKVYALDSDGNSKAAAAMKNRADRSANPGAAAPTQVTAKVTGKREGETIKVETIDVQ